MSRRKTTIPWRSKWGVAAKLHRFLAHILTLADADDAVRREGRLVIVHIYNVNTQGRGTRQLRWPFVSSDNSDAVGVPDLSVQHNVGLHQPGERGFDYESVVMVTVHDVVEETRVGTLIGIRGWYLKEIQN